MRKTLKKAIASFAACTMAIALVAGIVPASADAATIMSKQGKKAAKAEFDADGTYHAYFCMQQTSSWIFRDEWYAKELGLTGTKLKEAGLSYDGGTIFQSGTDGVTAIDGTVVTDVEIKGNGTYTVGVEGLNGVLTSAPSDAVLSMVYVTTDIPMSAKDNPVTISDWKLEMDGSEVTLRDDIYYPAEYTDASGLLRFDAVNTYQSDKGDYEGAPTVMAPQDSIKLTFTVSGFNSDNPDAVAAAEEPAADDAAGTTDATSATDTTDGSSSGGSSATTIVIVVIAIVVVAGVVVVVVKKKKN